MSFKVGDKVKILDSIDKEDYHGLRTLIGRVGTVVSLANLEGLEGFGGGQDIMVDGHRSNCDIWYFAQHELELVTFEPHTPVDAPKVLEYQPRLQDMLHDAEQKKAEFQGQKLGSKEGQALRYNEGKIEYSRFPMYVLEDPIRVLMRSVVKYPDKPDGTPNYEDLWGDETRKVTFDCTMRHLMAYYYKKELHDKESGCMHLSHALLNLSFALMHEMRQGYEPKESQIKPKDTK